MKEPGYNSHLILECEEIEGCVEAYRASVDHTIVFLGRHSPFRHENFKHTRYMKKQQITIGGIRK